MKIIILIGLLFSSIAVAEVQVGEFSNPGHEALYRDLIDELRCLVCQNQTLADSNAELAQDLRRQTHEMVIANKNKGEIIEYMVARYGDFVLYRPPFKKKTWLLWVGPFVLLVSGFLILIFILRRSGTRTEADFSDDDYQRASKLLDKNKTES